MNLHCVVVPPSGGLVEIIEEVLLILGVASFGTGYARVRV
jgi:hypothetical protein